MSAQTVTVNSGPSIGFGGLLTLLVITLKLTGVVAWSWVWVLAPLWIPVAFFLAVLLVVLLVVVAKT